MAGRQAGQQAAERAAEFREKRMGREAQKFASLTLEKDGLYLDPESTSTAKDCKWIAYLQGPLDSYWSSGVFKVEITFPPRYPSEPLTIKFADPIVHPNVDPKNGTLCIRMLQDFWSPTINVLQVLVYVRSVLDTPNFSSSDAQEACTKPLALPHGKGAASPSAAAPPR